MNTQQASVPSSSAGGAAGHSAVDRDERYGRLILRNKDYVTENLQKKIRNTKLLIAGCGIGSSFAEVAVRLGFENFILADGDIVSTHNLNRQSYIAADVGQPKVKALAKHLKDINPDTKIEEFHDYLNEHNVAPLVARTDIIFDTIDFLDLTGIVSLHDACRQQQKPIITALAIGWGAGCIYFPPGCNCSFRKLFALPETGSVANANYVDTFAVVIERLASRLDPTVVHAVGKALTMMEDGKPCPASQVSAGAFSVGALAGTLVVRILAGDKKIKQAPELLIADMAAILLSPGINLLEND